MKSFSLFLTILAFVAVATAQPKRPITFDDLITMGRIGDPQISPDGKTVAFVMTTFDKAANTSTSNIYLVPTEGGVVHQLTNGTRSNANPRWTPDGRTIAFVSSRDGDSQIWTIPVTGGEARKVSSISTGASGMIISHDGRWFAFASDVYPDLPDDAANKARMEQEEHSKVKAKIFDHLPYRVWNYWKDGKRSHVFVMPVAGGMAMDRTPGDYDTPPIDLGGNWDYDFSPDGKELTFTRNTDPMVAISTNNDLFSVPVSGGSAKRITPNPANDSQPLYSPDGKFIAYRAMRRPGFEADRKELVLYNRATGDRKSLTENFDYSINDVVWAPDGKSLFVTADDKGSVSVFRIWTDGRKPETVIDKGYNHNLAITPDGTQLVFIRERINMPAELYRINVDGKNLTQLTMINTKHVAELDMNPIEDFWFKGAGGTQVHGWIIKPPAFDKSKHYPMIYLVHGGPQGQWGDQFHYRWNAEMFASRGYVVLMVNPRGSTGYGQKFTDEISRDWGGKVYVDLMNGLDYALKTFSFIDAKRVAAAGASYGGYMMNWMGGHTNRFRCIVTHDGVFNPKSMYGSTEELWFPEWEFGGELYKHPKLYDQWSPLNAASNFKTPTLVVHGQRDFRVDVSEGFQLFTALQRQGVKSKMLYFPDEGHFVTKPQNAELWYKTVLDWIDENTK